MGKTITIDVDGVDKLERDLILLSKTKRLRQAIGTATAIVEGAAKTLCPTNKYRGGGELRQSIHPEVKDRGDEIVGRIYTNKEYAPYVEFGTGIKGGTHPKTAELGLTFRTDVPWVFTPDNGETFFRTSGQVAQPFMYPALKQNKTKINKLITDALRNEL